MEEETKAKVLDLDQKTEGQGKEGLKPSMPQEAWNEKTLNNINRLFEKIVGALKEGRVVKIMQEFTDVASDKDEVTGVHKVKIGSGLLISFLIDVGRLVVVESEGIEELNKKLETLDEEPGKGAGL